MNSRFPESIRPEIEAALTFVEHRNSGPGSTTTDVESHSAAGAGSARTGATLIDSISPLAGGCVSPAARLRTSNGLNAFVKWSLDGPSGQFQAEAEGLRALARAADGQLRVPEVLGVGDNGAGVAWLLLEFITPDPASGRANPQYRGEVSFGVRLGRGLAALHRAAPPQAGNETYGWRCDNFIGPLPQRNTPSGSWSDFWRNERLIPQLARARKAGYFKGSEAGQWDEVLEALDRLLEGAELDGPSVLHGDFWSGNAFAGPGGEAVVIDPAVYRGHREADLAMAELFGGFPGDFLPAYREAWPLRPGYERVRRDVYQLYPLLVHVNLFGGGYAARVSEKLQQLLRA